MDTDSYKSILERIYGTDGASFIETALQKYSPSGNLRETAHPVAFNDCCLIAYADSIQDIDGSPLEALKKFIERYRLQDVFSLLHLLPFFPWDTDRGFSVIDYYEVSKDAGTWGDITALNGTISLMFDFVANHASIDNPLVQRALIERHLTESHKEYESYKAYKDYVIAFSDSTRPDDDDLVFLSRPRKGSVMSPYVVLQEDSGLHAILCARDQYTGEADVLGSGYVWTTFSRPRNENGTEGTRQVDLNFKNPAVFVEAMKILLFYYEKGASHIRLDAIGYLWKKLGSYSLHEDETHEILYCWYCLLQRYAPEVVTIAEVNEPQQRVFTYLGSSERPESDLVYQFTHFPLAMYSLHFSDSTYYKQWLDTLKPAVGRQFITVLGSHDGMGMKPILGLLPEDRQERFSKHLVENFGGLPNYATLPGGKEIIYEVCGTPWSLINGDGQFDEDTALKRYLLIVNMGLLVRGLPAIYLNGLLAAGAYSPEEGLDEHRTVNREQRQLKQLDELYAEGSSFYGRGVMQALCELLTFRSEHPAFDPAGPCAECLESDKRILAVRLCSSDGSGCLLFYGNLSGEESVIDFSEYGTVKDARRGKKLPSGTHTLSPYESLWIQW